MRRWFVSLAFLASVLLAAGCGERSEPLGELPQAYPVTVPGAGAEPTTVTTRPERIVALDPGAVELIVALGAGDRLVGIAGGVSGVDAPQVVGRTQQVDVDAVVDLEPDLVVATPGVDELDVAQAARESGAAEYIRPDSSVDAVVRGTIELGFLLGEPVRARELAGRIRAKVARVEARVADEPLTTVFVDTGFSITIPADSLLGDLISRARGESVAGRSPGPDPFPAGRLRRLDPEVYLATTDSRVTLADLRADGRTAELTAVKNGSFAVLPANLVLRPGPRVGGALERVAEALHPDAFR